MVEGELWIGVINQRANGSCPSKALMEKANHPRRPSQGLVEVRRVLRAGRA